MLMVLLAITRSVFIATSIDIDMNLLQKVYYPTSTFVDDQQQYVNDNFYATSDGLEMSSMLEFTRNEALIEFNNYTVYSPLLDPQSPYYFMPLNCENKPLIGYISAVGNNEVV